MVLPMSFLTWNLNTLANFSASVYFPAPSTPPSAMPFGVHRFCRQFLMNFTYAAPRGDVNRDGQGQQRRLCRLGSETYGAKRIDIWVWELKYI